MNIEELIALYYSTETAVVISPHTLRKRLQRGDESMVLVDVRSRAEYEQGHVITAHNVPAYANPDTPAYDQRERIAAGFRELPQASEIVLYCYSKACMTGKKVGALLSERGIFAKHLGIGWNEWRYGWRVWNHEHEWDTTRVEDYIAEGCEPGRFRGDSATGLECEC